MTIAANKISNYQAIIFVLILTIVGLIAALSIQSKNYSGDLSQQPDEFEMRGGDTWGD